MGCPSNVTLENDLVFSITTHDPDTGILTDADSNPAYRVYEDETVVAILTGNMAKLDDANTTGFYTELLNCTAANGFEPNKNYTIYIEATVDSDQGGISYNFIVGEISGPGIEKRDYQVLNEVTLLPEESVHVWIYTDVALTDLIWYGLTDVNGYAEDAGGTRPYLNAGTYYFVRSKTGLTFTNPDTEVFT